MLKIHGTVRSRTARTLWALEELGVAYEHVPTDSSQAKSSGHLALNPNGHVPVLEDGPTVLWESMAINLYLAEKYGRAPFWPSPPEDHGRCYMWSFWAMTELEPHLLTFLMHRVIYPAERRDEQAAKQAADTLKAPLRMLNDHLAGRDYLLGSDFTVADLNVASVLSWALFGKLDLSGVPAAETWLRKCVKREANQRVYAMR